MLAAVAGAMPCRAADSGAKDLTAEKIDVIKHKVEELRNLKFTSEVNTEFIGKDAMSKVVERIMIVQGVDTRRIEIMRKMMEAFGLVPAGYDLASALRSVLTEQVQGIYDPNIKTLYVRNDISFGSEMPDSLEESGALNESELTLSHEIDHALQDQHFNLMRILDARWNNEDAAFAFDTVAEGDATIVMLDYGMRDLGFVISGSPQFAKLMETMLYSASGEQFAAFNSMPAVIREQMVFPYSEGMIFVAGLYSDGGWPLVDYAFENPPQSTEQIIHPEKFLKNRDNPVAIGLPDITEYLGAGYKLLDSNTLGEFQTRLILQEFAEKDADSKAAVAKAAAGWGGDRYGFYENADGKQAMIWLTAWDSAGDGDEFEASMTAALTKRFSAPPTPASGANIWAAPCGKAAVMKSLDEVAFIYCAPQDQIENIARAMFNSKRTAGDSKPPDLKKFKKQP